MSWNADSFSELDAEFKEATCIEQEEYSQPWL
jgi:hypothetical protein